MFEKKKAYALITGASSGIGEECARRMAANGRNLILIARRLELLEELKKELEAVHTVEILVFKVDLRNVQEIDDFYSKISDRAIDILVNSAGMSAPTDKFEDLPWEKLEEIIETNIKGLTKITHRAIPFLKKTKGHVINMGSFAALMSYEKAVVYCGSKAYVKMLSSSLRLSLRNTGVRVTEITAGVVDTEFWDKMYGGDHGRAKKMYKDFDPLHASDIVDCILFAIDRPEYVNIDTIVVRPRDDTRRL